MCGSRTIAVASFACHCCTVCSSTCSAFAWMWLSSVRKTSRPSRAGRCWIVFTDWPSASRTKVALPGVPFELLVQLELEPRETGVVRARVAEHRRRHRPLRIDALLVRSEGEADEVALLERGRELRRRLPLDVDEASAAVGELPVQRLERDPEHLRRDPCLAARIGDLHRVGVDVDRLLANGQRIPIRS